jgi:hypothetical protein
MISAGDKEEITGQVDVGAEQPVVLVETRQAAAPSVKHQTQAPPKTESRQELQFDWVEHAIFKKKMNEFHW